MHWKQDLAPLSWCFAVFVEHSRMSKFLVHGANSEQDENSRSTLSTPYAQDGVGGIILHHNCTVESL